VFYASSGTRHGTDADILQISLEELLEASP
jgi:hypothetical protein